MNVNRPKISVITPCFNSAPWLETTLGSLYAQDMTDWEILLVDDGSTDSTLSVLRQHEGVRREGGEVRIFSSRNAGVAAARNLLLREARGEYLLFLDSDDLLPPGSLTYLLHLIEEEKADVAEGRILCYPDGREGEILNRLSRQSVGKKLLRFNGRDAVESSLYQTCISSSFSGKLFRRELFAGIEFPEGRLYEDLCVFHLVVMRAERYIRGEKVVYLYRQHSGSLIHTFNRDRLDVLDITAGIERHMHSLGDTGLMRAAADRRLSAAFNMLGLLLAHPDVIPAAESHRRVAECRNIIRSYRRSTLLNPRTRMRNRIGSLLAMLLPTPLLDRLLHRQYHR